MSRGWRNFRLIIGFVFVAIAVLVGWQVIEGLAERQTAWAARVDLPRGLRLSFSDISEVPVSLGASSAFHWLGKKPPVGQVITTDVRAGQLLLRSSVAQQLGESVRLVTVGVEPDHAPLVTKRGDVVDVYSVEEEELRPKLVLSGVVVDGVADAPSGLGGFASTRVSLLVSSDEVVNLVNANRLGRVDLVLHADKP